MALVRLPDKEVYGMSNGDPIQSLWLGDKLSNMERLSMSSFACLQSHWEPKVQGIENRVARLGDFAQFLKRNG
jgi:hypothetical protein